MRVIAIFKVLWKEEKYKETKTNFDGTMVQRTGLKFGIGGAPTQGSFHNKIG